jgi:hypothetical protein
MGPAKRNIDVAITGTRRFEKSNRGRVKAEALNHHGFRGAVSALITTESLPGAIGRSANQRASIAGLRLRERINQ